MKFTKNATKEEITMLLTEFMNQESYHPAQIAFIKRVTAANTENTDWDQLTNVVFYNDVFFQYLMHSETLEDFVSFMIAVAGQSPQWNFLLRFGVLKKIEIFVQPTTQWVDSTAELLHNVLVGHSKGSGTLSVDMLVKSAAYFKKADRLTLQGVVGLLEAVSSSQQPKLAVLQEYLVMLLDGIKSSSVSTNVPKDSKQLVYLKSSKAEQQPQDEDGEASRAPKKADLSRYYLILKHLLASKKINFEENQQLSKVIAPVYLPDLKTGIFIISVSHTGLKENNPEAKLVKKVTRQIFENMVEGCQVVILYPTDFDPSPDGEGVDSILEQVAASTAA